MAPVPTTRSVAEYGAVVVTTVGAVSLPQRGRRGARRQEQESIGSRLVSSLRVLAVSSYRIRAGGTPGCCLTQSFASPRWARGHDGADAGRDQPSERSVRRLLEGSGRLPAEHLRHADRPDAVGARQPAGQRRSHRVGAGCQGGRRAARRKAPPVSKLPAPALGDHGAVGQRRSDRGVEGRRPRGVGRRPRAGHRRQLHLRRPCQRRRRPACDQHLQDPAEPRARAAGAGRRDPRHVRRQSGLRRARAPLAGLSDLARRRPLHHDPQCRHQHHRPDGDAPHRSEHLPIDRQERDDRFPCAVARVLSLARSGESQSRAGLHGDLDRWRCRTRNIPV